MRQTDRFRIYFRRILIVILAAIGFPLAFIGMALSGVIGYVAEMLDALIEEGE